MIRARVEANMLHPHTELRHVSKLIGYGVFATQLIPKGTITWVRDDLDQTFSPGEIAGFRQEYQDHFTDDASVIESMGEKLHLIEGDATNIKITRQIDLLIAEKILEEREMGL